MLGSGTFWPGVLEVRASLHCAFFSAYSVSQGRWNKAAVSGYFVGTGAKSTLAAVQGVLSHVCAYVLCVACCADLKFGKLSNGHCTVVTCLMTAVPVVCNAVADRKSVV